MSTVEAAPPSALPSPVAAHDDVSDRKLNRVLLTLAGPTLVSGLLKATFALADTFSAGMLHTDALAGLSAAVSFLWMLQSCSYSTSMGTLSRVSHAKGAGDHPRMTQAFSQGVLFAAVVGALVALAFVGLTHVVVPRLGLTSAVQTETFAYLQALLLFGPAWWLFDTLEQAFRAASDAKTPMLAMGLAALLNTALNPTLALGWWGAPQMGLFGVALATGISWTVGAVLLLVIAHRRGWFALAHSRFAWRDLVSTLRIGVPTSVSGAGFDIIWIFLTPLIAQSGPAALAAVSVGHRLEAVAWMLAQGMGGAAGATVGQSMGAGNPALARRYAWRACVFAFSIAGLWAVVLLSNAEALYSVFTDDVDVARFGVSYIACAAVPMVFQGLEVVLLGAFAGFGRTFWPSVVVFASYALRLPVAFAWAEDGGALGVYMAIGLTATLAGMGSVLAFVIWGPKATDTPAEQP